MLTGEGDGLWQSDDGNISPQVVGVPVGVFNMDTGRDFNAAGLGGQTDVVGTQHDVDEGSSARRKRKFQSKINDLVADANYPSVQ